MVEDFLKLGGNTDPQTQESQQILSLIQKKTKAPQRVVQRLDTEDTEQTHLPGTALTEPGSTAAGARLRSGCSLTLLLGVPQVSSPYLYLRGSPFSFSTLSFQWSLHRGCPVGGPLLSLLGRRVRPSVA